MTVTKQNFYSSHFIINLTGIRFLPLTKEWTTFMTFPIDFFFKFTDKIIGSHIYWIHSFKSRNVHKTNNWLNELNWKVWTYKTEFQTRTLKGEFIERWWTNEKLFAIAPGLFKTIVTVIVNVARLQHCTTPNTIDVYQVTLVLKQKHYPPFCNLFCMQLYLWVFILLFIKDKQKW